MCLKNQWFRASNAPEELKVQACLGQEELIILLEPHLAHSSVLEEMNTQAAFIVISLEVNSAQR